MKLMMTIALSCACVLCQNTRANEADVSGPRWVIIARIIDQMSGEEVRQEQLPGAELEFHDAASCKAVVDRVSPVHEDHLAIVLTCRKISSLEATL